ncbi:MAG: glycoside hydrolase family 65 protein [Clostridia bacterium]|nr:glycoside hydrolase family 65 protein [Clostridia bacterium]
MKKHTITHWNKNAPKAYVSNGFIGFRIGKNPFSDISGMLTGFSVGIVPEHSTEELVHIPVPHISFSYKGDTVIPEILSQTYDFSNGELSTESLLHCIDGDVTLSYTVFCCRTSPTLFIGSLCANGNLPDDLNITVHFPIEKNPYTISGWECSDPNEDLYDGKCLIHSYDNSSTAGIAYTVLGAFSNKSHEPFSNMITRVTVNTNNSPIHIVTSYVPGIMHGEPHNQAQRMLGLAKWSTVDHLYEQNREAWEKLWKSRITIEGAQEEWQNVIDASFFYLMSSVSEFSPMSIPPFGLSSPLYGGHCFWDTESFMFMPPLFFAPEIARSMLDYRSRQKEDAENNARINGYRGIQYPWQTCVHGYELTPPFCTQAGEQHINLDIGLAFDGYARVHGDKAYIKENVWPIIHGICEWIESRVKKTDRGYEIHHITGIDEETDDVNNDSYSNIMSAKLLRSGSEYSVMIGFGERERWLDIADNLYIPIRENGVLEQYEGMDDRAKHASTTVMSYFPYGFTNGNESDLKTFAYYISHGMFEYCRYPMLSGFLGIFPAWMGDRETSLKFYEEANLTFFSDPFYACTEYAIQDPADRINPKKPLKTCFITGRASLLSGLIMGLTKICPWKGSVDAPIEQWLGENIVLPNGWTKITIGHVTIRGKDYRIEAEHGAKHARLIAL